MLIASFVSQGRAKAALFGSQWTKALLLGETSLQTFPVIDLMSQEHYILLGALIRMATQTACRKSQQCAAGCDQTAVAASAAKR